MRWRAREGRKERRRFHDFGLLAWRIGARSERERDKGGRNGKELHSRDRMSFSADTKVDEWGENTILARNLVL